MRSSRHSRYTVHVLYAKLRKGRFGAFNLLQSSVIRDSKSPESRMLRSQRDSHVLSTLKISSQLIVSQQPKSSAAHGNLTLTLTLRFQALLYYILRTSPDSSSSCYRLLYLHQGTTEEYCDFTRRLTLSSLRSRLDLRETHARAPLPIALASVSFVFVLDRVSVRERPARDGPSAVAKRCTSCYCHQSYSWMRHLKVAIAFEEPISARNTNGSACYGNKSFGNIFTIYS